MRRRAMETKALAAAEQQVPPFFLTNRVDVPLPGTLNEVGVDYIVIGSDVLPLSAIAYVRFTGSPVPPAGPVDPKRTFSLKLTEYLNQKRQLQVLFMTDQVQHFTDGFTSEVGPTYVVLRSGSVTDIIPFSAIGFVRPH
jgi:hypothetical protein